jgi:hypothetical protein
MGAGLSSFTLSPPTRGQQVFRAAREAWRAGRSEWAKRQMDDRDARGVKMGKAVSDQRITVGQMVQFVGRGSYKVSAANGIRVEMAGLREWVAAVDAEYRAKLLQVVDDEVSAFVFWTWRTWPYSTGWSKSLLDYRWEDLPSGPVVTFLSQAPYTLVAKGTRNQFSAARTQFGRLPLAISARMEGFRHG